MLKIQENVENFSGGVSSGVREGGYSIGETDPNTENIKSLLELLLFQARVIPLVVFLKAQQSTTRGSLQRNLSTTRKIFSSSTENYNFC